VLSRKFISLNRHRTASARTLQASVRTASRLQKSKIKPMTTLKPTEYKNIFKELEKTFFKQSDLTASKLTKNLESFKKIKKQKREDNEYF